MGPGLRKFVNTFAKPRLSKGTSDVRLKGCLVIDEISPKSIIYSNIPQPWLSGRFAPDYGFPCTAIVGMIDGQFPDIRDRPRYTGYMRVYLRYLWKLYRQFSEEDMRDSIPYLYVISERLIPVYDGDTGEAQDEQGKIYKALSRQR